VTSGSRPPRALSRAERDALVAGVRNTAKAGEASRPTSPLPVVAAGAASFDQLPGYESIRLQKSLAEQLAIAVPFYRVHDARAGVRTEIDGRILTNFTSYDYLGLNGHPEITAAVAAAADRWGTSVSASRLTSGERPFHRQLEQELAHLYDAEDALVFVSGHATNLALISTMFGSEDIIVHDALAHNSIVLGAEISGAHRRYFPHNDIEALDTLLASIRHQFRHCLIATEGLFSMDGDGPDLARLVEVKQRHNAWLLVDEAHSLGVLGKTGRGLAEHAGVDPRQIDIWMGTLSKSLVSCGGYVAAPRALIEYLKYRAPGMVYSVGISPPASVAALTALDIMLREPERVASLQENGQLFRDRMAQSGHDVGQSWGLAVTPVILGDSLLTVLLADRLLERGMVVVPVIPPGVPERSARLRFFLSSGHSAADIEQVVEATDAALAELRQANLSLASIAAERLRSHGAGTKDEG
jgi:8-amino-7-oxononanoate synthase